MKLFSLRNRLAHDIHILEECVVYRTGETYKTSTFQRERTDSLLKYLLVERSSKDHLKGMKQGA